jgi:hypothetical protein
LVIIGPSLERKLLLRGSTKFGDNVFSGLALEFRFIKTERLFVETIKCFFKIWQKVFQKSKVDLLGMFGLEALIE